MIPENLQNSLLDIGEYLSMGWSEFTKNFKTFLILMLLINLPIAIVGLFLPTTEEPTASEMGITVVFGLLSVILGTLAALAIPKVIECSIQGQMLNATTALQTALPKLLIALLVSFVASLLVGIGFILLFIPGIWLGVLLSFTFHAVALRDCGFNALDYSRSLVKGRWWSVFGRSFLLGFCFVLLFLILALAVGIIGGLISLVGLGIAVQVLSSLIFALINYYGTTVYTIMFLNFDYTRNLPLDTSST
jgi:hypothetical protein